MVLQNHKTTDLNDYVEVYLISLILVKIYTRNIDTFRGRCKKRKLRPFKLKLSSRVTGIVHQKWLQLSKSCLKINFSSIFKISLN